MLCVATKPAKFANKKPIKVALNVQIAEIKKEKLSTEYFLPETLWTDLRNFLLSDLAALEIKNIEINEIKQIEKINE